MIKWAGVAASILVATAAAGCGAYTDDGRAPARVVMRTLEGASGARPDAFGTTLSSDVLTVVAVTPPGAPAPIAVPTIFGDAGRATLTLVLRDPGVPGIGASPSALNQVQISRYRVSYRRTDGRNTPGVDVPFAFDSAVTGLVPSDADVTVGFVLVRNTAKSEAPLAGR